MGKAHPEFVPPKPPVKQVVMVGGRDQPRKSPDRGVARPPALDKTQAELDRVLDKISAKGMNSLSPTERKFLDEVAKKKKEH
jgi:hypothetical protein